MLHGILHDKASQQEQKHKYFLELVSVAYQNEPDRHYRKFYMQGNVS